MWVIIPPLWQDTAYHFIIYQLIRIVKPNFWYKNSMTNTCYSKVFDAQLLECLKEYQIRDRNIWFSHSHSLLLSIKLQITNSYLKLLWIIRKKITLEFQLSQSKSFLQTKLLKPSHSIFSQIASIKEEWRYTQSTNLKPSGPNLFFILLFWTLISKSTR